MAESDARVVVTARRLADGAPVFLTSAGAWSTALGEAVSFDAEQASQEASARGQTEQHLVCDPYTFPVRVADGVVEPVSTRERIRSQGPTVPIRRPD